MDENSIQDQKQPNCTTIAEQENQNPNKTKKYRKPMLWVFEKAYSNAVKADREKKNFNNWSVYRTHKIETGKEKYFQCNRVKLRDENQSSTICLLYDSVKERVLRFRTSEQPNQEQLEHQAEFGLSTEVRGEVEKLFNLNMKPTAILNSLAKMSCMPMPSKTQLNNYLMCLRKDKCKPVKINVKQLSGRLKERSVLSCNEHASFVVAHEVSCSGDADPMFRFFISTKHLIGLARNAKVIQVSAAFNIFWQTFPMFVIGTTDKDSKFHPFGLTVSKQGITEDFKFFFSAVKEFVKVHHKVDLAPKFLICNAEEHIQRGFKEVFGPDIGVLTCWAYVRKQIIRRVLNDISVNQRIAIMNDIDKLQLAGSKEVFQKACGYFLEKWQHEKAFCKYFKSEWVEKNQNWFEGIASGFPSTNSGLEAFSLAIKNNKALRVRFTLENFLLKAMDMVSDWSNEYKFGTKKVTDAPTISERLWVDSYQWAKLPKNILKSGNNENCSLYRVPAENNSTNIERHNYWFSFDSYKELYFNECQVSLPLEREGWLRGKCNCPSFMKMFMCKHILGMAITLKEVKVPSEVRDKGFCEMYKRAKAQRNRAMFVDL